MGTIFDRAKRILVSLGRPTDDSRLLMGTVRDALTSASEEEWIYWFQTLESKCTEERLMRLCQAVITIANNPYWRRVWIVEELAVARDISVLCGYYKLRWTVLSSLVSHLPGYMTEHSRYR